MRFLRFPSRHGHLTWVVLKPGCLAGDELFQDAKYNFGLVLLKWEQVFGKTPMKCAALRTADTGYPHPLCPPTFRPYNSLQGVVVLQLPAAFRAG